MCAECETACADIDHPAVVSFAGFFQRHGTCIGNRHTRILSAVDDLRVCRHSNPVAVGTRIGSGGYADILPCIQCIVDTDLQFICNVFFLYLNRFSGFRLDLYQNSVALTLKHFPVELRPGCLCSVLSD